MDGIVEIRCFDQVVSAELFLRLGERAVGGRDLSVPDAHGRGRIRRLEGIAAKHVTALLDLLSEREVLLGHGNSLPGVSRGGLVVLVDQAQVLHGVPPVCWIS